MNKQIIAWDLGATKCAAGVVEYNTQTGDLECVKQFSIKLSEADSLPDLVSKIETGLDYEMRGADAICIGAAGHFDGEQLLLDKLYRFPMPLAQTARNLRWPSFAVVHDYAPIVCATFTNYMTVSQNVKRLNSCSINPEGRRVALGIGTGLGMKDGALLENGDFWLGKNEAGHIGICTPPFTSAEYLARHGELINFLQTLDADTAHPSVTFEKILSGNGTVRLYQFFYPGNETISPEEVGEKMRLGEAQEMVAAFAWYLGLFVGTVQLLFMPEGGLWITGGVALKNLDVFDHPEFFAGIQASPAYRAQRDGYALGVLCNDSHALIGSGYYASRRLLHDSGVMRLKCG